MYMLIEQKPTKTKTPQPKTPEKKQDRDGFYTPRYATEIIIPYIPKNIKNIWDVGAGRHFIGNVLEEFDYRVLYTDIDGNKNNVSHNFLTEDFQPLLKIKNIEMLVSNIPFSLKPEFINRAIEIGLPFCFLMPFDISGYLWEMFKNKGLQAIVPERRIDFITPNIVTRVNEYLGICAVNKIFKTKYKLNNFLKQATKEELSVYSQNIGSYLSIEQIPNSLLRKLSSSDFHSFWLCGKMNLEKDFMFVELSNKEKDNIL